MTQLSTIHSIYLPTTDIHAITQAPICRRNMVQYLFHLNTIILTQSYPATSTTTLFFNDNALNQTLHILHKQSFKFLYTTFMAVTHNPTANLGRVYHKALERDGGPILDHLNLHISCNINRGSARFCLISLIKYYTPISDVTNEKVAKLVDFCFVIIFNF